MRAALEQKEVELQHKEAELQGKEAELQCEKATVTMLSGTLEEKGKALKEKEVAIRNAEAALKEKEDSLSSLEEAARVQQEEAQKNITGECSRLCCCHILIHRSLSWFFCPELRQRVADETVAKEAVNTALMAAQAEYTDLERTAVGVCQELKGDGAVSGSSVVNRLRALGGWIAEHGKSTFRLGILRALVVASTHYIMDLQRVSLGYVVPTDADADAASTIMDDDVAAEEFATVLAAKLEADIPA